MVRQEQEISILGSKPNSNGKKYAISLRKRCNTNPHASIRTSVRITVALRYKVSDETMNFNERALKREYSKCHFYGALIASV